MTSVTKQSPATLILLRHGQSEWNATNRFTGWYDCGLSAQGETEARDAGQALREAGLLPDIVHTSTLRRAIHTASLALDVMDRAWIPARRHWRLNERHYGDLTGKDKAETRERYGTEQLSAWRRGYTTPPPPVSDENPWNPNRSPQYATLPPELLPRSECLQDVVQRLLPYWYDVIVNDLADRKVVLVSAHGNSLRALAKHLDNISDKDIAELNIPTGVPLIYQLGPDMAPLEAKTTLARSLDPAAAAEAAAAVAAQAG